MLTGIFIEPPHPEASTTTAADNKPKRFSQTDVDIKMGLTSTLSTVPEVMPTHPEPAGIVYIFMESIQALVQHQAQTDSQFAYLL